MRVLTEPKPVEILFGTGYSRVLGLSHYSSHFISEESYLICFVNDNSTFFLNPDVSFFDIW